MDLGRRGGRSPRSAPRKGCGRCVTLSKTAARAHVEDGAAGRSLHLGVGAPAAKSIAEGLTPDARCPEAYCPEAYARRLIARIKAHSLLPGGSSPEGLLPEGLPPEGLVPEGLRPMAKA